MLTGTTDPLFPFWDFFFFFKFCQNIIKSPVFFFCFCLFVLVTKILKLMLKFLTPNQNIFHLFIFENKSKYFPFIYFIFLCVFLRVIFATRSKTEKEKKKSWPTNPTWVVHPPVNRVLFCFVFLSPNRALLTWEGPYSTDAGDGFLGCCSCGCQGILEFLI